MKYKFNMDHLESLYADRFQCDLDILKKYEDSLEFIKQNYYNHGFGDSGYDLIMKIDPKIFDEKFRMLSHSYFQKNSDLTITLCESFILNFDPEYVDHYKTMFSEKDWKMHCRVMDIPSGLSSTINNWNDLDYVIKRKLDVYTDSGILVNNSSLIKYSISEVIDRVFNKYTFKE